VISKAALGAAAIFATPASIAAASRTFTTLNQLLQQLEPFADDAVFELGEPGDIAARARQAVDDPEADRVDGLGKHDRHVPAGLHQGHYRDPGRRHDHVRPERDQLHGMGVKTLGIAVAPTVVDQQVSPDRPAQLLQLLFKR
jgi:hypothetical protein